MSLIQANKDRGSRAKTPAFTLIELCQRQTLPVVLLLEDLHWASASLELLRRFLRVIDQ